MQRSGRLLGLIASLALAALTASPASAAVVVDTTGSHGRYAVKDNDNHQGARCAYETASLDLDRITVHGPTVWARDKTSHRDGQWVGWNLLVQKRPAAGGAWSTVHTSTTDEGYAYDDAPASFDQQTWKAPEHLGNASWRIEVVLTWYHFVETGPQPVEGTVTLRLKHYTDRWNGNIYPDQPLCVSHF
jgi:hypothetical protein